MVNDKISQIKNNVNKKNRQNFCSWAQRFSRFSNNKRIKKKGFKNVITIIEKN